MLLHSFIIRAVTIQAPARAERGRRAIIGPKMNIDARSPSECTMPQTLVLQTVFSNNAYKYCGHSAGRVAYLE